MKKVILYLMLPTLLCDCKNDKEQQKNISISKPEILAVTEIDYTLSTNTGNQIVYYDSATAIELYNTLSSAGSGTIKM